MAAVRKSFRFVTLKLKSKNIWRMLNRRMLREPRLLLQIL